MQRIIVNAVGVFKIVELTVATILNSFGLYLLATAKKKKIMILLMIQLIFVEFCCTLLWSVEETYLYVSGKWPIDRKTSYNIIIVLLTTQFLTLGAITLERALAVLLHIKYRVIATKKKLVLVLACIWLISLSTMIILKFSRKVTFNRIMLFWDALLMVIYTSSYAYIFLAVRRRRLRFAGQTSGSIRNGLNLRVPFLLVFSLVCFCLIPDLVLVAGLKRPFWYSSIIYLNYISDPFIYLFGMSECKRRMKDMVCCIVNRGHKKINSQTVTTSKDDSYPLQCRNYIQ